jgi:hypothetical protein
VSDSAGLYQALTDIASFVNESAKDFASSTVSSVQAGGDQMVYLATFNAASNRSIWNGRVNGYKLDAQGNIQMGTKTIPDPIDPTKSLMLPAPSNDPTSLIWNAGQNLVQTPGTGPRLLQFSPPAPRWPRAATWTTPTTRLMIATRFYRAARSYSPCLRRTRIHHDPALRGGHFPESRYDRRSTWPPGGGVESPAPDRGPSPAVRSPALLDDDGLRCRCSSGRSGRGRGDDGGESNTWA